MNELSARLRASLWWLLPLALLALAIGWEIDWGDAVRLRPPPPEPIAPKPVTAGLLPDYVIEGGIATHAETVNRTLFNPTRRPAPTAVAEVAKPKMEKGLFTLTGTTVAGDRSLAFLKETKGGKPRTVKKGDTINGMLVADVQADRVKLTLADDYEEIMLKVATNPKPTPQPAVAQAPGAPPQGAAAISPGTPPRPAAAAGQDAGQTLAERRRAARAAATAAAAAATPPAAAPAPQTGVPAPTPAQPAAAQSGAAGQATDQGWSRVYQRYQQRGQQK